jgi:hypothetical protein
MAWQPAEAEEQDRRPQNMATRSEVKTEAAGMPPPATAADLRLARQVHTLAHVLYGQMTSIYPDPALRMAAPSAPGFVPGMPTSLPVAGPAFFPWMVGMPNPVMPVAGMF